MQCRKEDHYSEGRNAERRYVECHHGVLFRIKPAGLLNKQKKYILLNELA